MGEILQIRSTSTEYPLYLRAIASPPKTLYYIGDLLPLLQKPRLAVIGSRKVTPYGREVTTRLAGDAAAQGIVIISGLALGVDGLAHQAALDAGGATIAVLPCGLDRIYPATHRQLAMDILRKGGAIVSEYPCGVAPLRQNFVARNRIVSGLSDGVLVTEAAEKSGTIHTANFALDQGRALMAVPGNISSPLSAGTNNLLKSCAALVTSVDDILHELGVEGQSVSREVFGASPEEVAILMLLQEGVSDGTSLQLQSKLAPALFNQTLTMLEITGKIRPLGSGHWTLT